MLAQAVFFLEHHDATVWGALGEVVGCRQSENAATNDGHGCLLHSGTPFIG
jgi:hypothetical protein